MSRITLKKLFVAVSHIAACGMLLALATKPVCAGEPEKGVIRTFAVLANTLEQVPDFGSEQSQGLVVGPMEPMQTASIDFAESEYDERFNSTTWVFQDAIHITTDGAEKLGNIVWLVTTETPEPPPIGAITFGGPDGPQILSQEGPFYYDTFGTGYQLRDPASGPGGAGLLVVVTAIFSR